MSWLRQPFKQGRLALVMSLVLTTLIFDVVSDVVCSCVLTDGVDVVPFRPELTAPQHPLDLGVPLEDPTRRNALDRLHEALRRCCGDGLYEKVRMISVRADFDEVDFISDLYCTTGFSERFDHTVG